MRRTIRWNRLIRVLMSGVVVLAIGSLHGLANAGPLDDTVWNLTGTAKVRIGSVSQTSSFSETLTLNADRTYLLHDESGSSVPDEVGAWFEYRGKVQLFPQNFLDFVEALEPLLSADAGEPVQISIIKTSQTASLDSKTGMLKMQSTIEMGAFLPQSNLALKLSGKSSATGMQAP